MKKDVYELTNPQKSIWFTEEFYKGTPINNICGNLIIREKVDFKKFIKSINLFVKTNESFRLKFFIENSTPKQYVSDFSEFNLEIIDVKSEEELLSLQEQTGSEVFEVIDSLLFKFKIVRLPDGSGGFIVNCHHLISDAATFAIIATEIVKIYSSLINKTEFEYNTNLYTNYIKSEQEYLKSEKFKKDEGYWLELYKEVPEVATVPSLLNKNENNSNESLRESFLIPKELFEKINNICRENRISSYNLFMAVYSIYLGRVSNLDEFVIGTPILNRTNFIEKNTSGMFISTAPFKINLNQELSFTDFVKKVGVDSLSMLRHQKYPYQFLLENLRKQNGHVPNLYDFMFSYQITKATDKNLDIPYTTHWTGNNKIANSLEVHAHDNDSNGTVTISYDYKIEKYTKEDITNIHNRILYILEQIISNPEIVLKDIEIVTPEEKHKILYEFNDTKKSFDYMPNIVLEIEKIAALNSNKIAIETDTKSITYKELIERINQLSNMLINSFSISPKSTIGISTNRTIDTIVGILAIAKINCTYVPIDPTYPKDRISNMIRDSQIKYILSDNYKADINSFENLKVLNINYSTYSNENTTFSKNIKYDKNSNLYIIFTSGSTGKPKGVTISHKNMLNLIYFEKNKTSIFLSDSKVLQFATMSFDVSYQEIYSALLTGNTLVLIDDLIRKDMLKLANHIANHNINVLFIPPAYLRLLTEDSDIISKLTKTLKSVITAGEQLIITKGIKELLTNGIEIHNHYGPAETHVATAFTVKSTNSTTPPIGYPISNTQVLILDKNSKLSPIGVLGEIVISGDCVGNGYYNNLELTNKKFLPNSFSNYTYYTGDLGYYDYSGCIYFVCRSDFQVKINGFRIELEEIDSVISSISLVDSVKSIIIEKDFKKHIITYYSSDSVTEEYIMQYLKDKLPYYMIPKKIVKLDKMPINANGKIDKNNLPEVELTINNNEIQNTTTDCEIKLQSTWDDLFKTNKIAINVNFFEIGGDSLLAIKLCAEIHKNFNIEINVQDIFSNPTIYELAKFLDTKKTSKNNLIIKTNLADFYPVSSAQKRIYYSSKVAGDTVAYNMPGALILSEMPNIEKLEKCFNEIILKHESLRTYFDVIGGEVVQKIKEKINFKIDFDEQICKDKYMAFTDFVKSFDLSKTPLLRAKLVKLEKNQALLLFDMHHIISDGASMQILIDDLCKLYNGENLSPLEITYKDYSVWEQNNLNENKLKQSEKFWVNQFKDDIPVLNLPTNNPRPTIQTFEGANIYKELDKNLTEKINTLAKELNITPYMLLLSCYYILLYKYTSNEDIIVGTPVVGRDNSQLDNIIGMFVNSLPLRKKLNSNETFLEFTNGVKELCLNAFQHQTYPFDELVNKLNIKRDSSRNPLFDTMFIYQNEGNAKVNLGNIKSKYYIPDSNISKFDLSLEIIPEDSKLNLRFEYATKLFNKDFIEHLSVHYINILKAILGNSNIKIADIEMLSEKDKNRILYKFNDTKVKYSHNKTIIKLFEEQVKKRPNTSAVIFENQKLSYKELNEKANNIANYLINKNVKQNDIIAILLPRSLDLISSIFGVLKAGAAYMLIDPNLPDERINYMLKNANAKILLTYKDFKKIKYNSLYIDSFELENTKNLNLKLSNENNLAVIYTSGSTGEPKGVLLRQLGLINLIHSFIKEMKIDKFKNFLSIAAVSFDMFTVETFCSLLLGKTLILTNEEEQKDPYKLGLLAEKHPIDFLITTPSRMDLFLSQEKSKI